MGFSTSRGPYAHKILARLQTKSKYVTISTPLISLTPQTSFIIAHLRSRTLPLNADCRSLRKQPRDHLNHSEVLPCLKKLYADTV